jgi:hypothetical protein
MLTLILKKFRSRLALVTVVAVAAGCIAAVSPQPASAQISKTAQIAAPAAAASPTIPTGKEQICLTHSNKACIGFPVQDVVQDVIAAAGVAAAWVAIFFQWISKGKGDGGQEGEEKDMGDADNSHHDPDAGLCLAQTDPNRITGYTGDLYMTKCGANGTVWIAIAHNGGDYLESRWWYNEGVRNEVISADPVRDGAHVYAAPAQSNGPLSQTWSWYSTTHK